MKQPLFPHPPNYSGSKKCWTCTTTTPYNQGFCEVCWEELPVPAKHIFQEAFVSGLELFRPHIQQAIVQGLQAKRFSERPKEPERVYFRSLLLPPVNIDDLDLDL